MATITKFTVPVTITQESYGIVSWICDQDMPRELYKLLREKDSVGQGWAWSIRLDRWISPEGEEMDRRPMFLAYNDATTPCIVSGNTDYSAMDD